MKKSWLFICSLMMLFCITYAQTSIIQTITDGLKNNDIGELLRQLDDDVQLTILEEEDSYEKEKGIGILQQFFETFPTETYQMKHSGESNDGSEFAIGEIDREGALYRIYFVVNEQKVSEFCIELD